MFTNTKRFFFKDTQEIPTKSITQLDVLHMRLSGRRRKRRRRRIGYHLTNTPNSYEEVTKDDLELAVVTVRKALELETIGLTTGILFTDDVFAIVTGIMDVVCGVAEETGIEDAREIYCVEELGRATGYEL